MGTYASGIAAIISGAGHWCEVKYSSKSGFDASLATSEFKIFWAPGLSRNRHFLLKMITCFRLSPTNGFAVAIAFCKALSISDGTNKEGFRHEDHAVLPWCIATLNIELVCDVITYQPAVFGLSGEDTVVLYCTLAIWIPSSTNLQERRIGEWEQGTGNL